MMRESTRYERTALRRAIAHGGPVLFDLKGAPKGMRDSMFLLGWIDEDANVTQAGRDMIESLRKPGNVYRLPGGGPWRIADECPADRHNTMYAARGYKTFDGNMIPGQVRCTCPRSIQLMRIHRRQTAEAQRRFYAKTPPAMPRWYTGPWRILPNCPATGHNVIARVIKPRDGKVCICPHAKEVHEEWKKRDNAQKRARRATRDRERKARERRIKIRAFRPSEVHLYQSPDFARGLCTKPNNMQVFDRAFTGKIARQKAKLICQPCPLFWNCREWAAREEGDRPGTLGGVWGGLEPAERLAEYTATKGKQGVK